MLTELFNNPFSFAIWATALLIAISIHEFSHAYLADYLGDPTAKLQGRLTLNPLSHLDLLGTLFLLVAHIGWGKPVPVNPFNLRHPRRDSALISLAGPISNFILAVIISLALRFLPTLPISHIFYLLFQTVLIPIIILNVGLGIFNLIPIAPLDGFKIVAGILPKDLSEQWQELEGMGILFLLLLLFPLPNGSLLNNFILPLISFVLNLMLPGFASII